MTMLAEALFWHNRLAREPENVAMCMKVDFMSDVRTVTIVGEQSTLC